MHCLPNIRSLDLPNGSKHKYACRLYEKRTKPYWYFIMAHSMEPYFICLHSPPDCCVGTFSPFTPNPSFPPQVFVGEMTDAAPCHVTMSSDTELRCTLEDGNALTPGTALPLSVHVHNRGVARIDIANPADSTFTPTVRAHIC